MTSNQLQFASNQISKQIADENARHNSANESEVNRHNLETERLTNNELELKDFYNQEVKRHNEALEDIQRRYNETYLQLQESQGQQKIDIEKYLADIEAEKTAETQRHNAENEWYNQQLAKIEQYKAEDTKSFHEATVENNEYLAELQSKKLFFDNQFNLNMSKYYEGVLQNQMAKTSLDAYLGMGRLKLDTYELQMNKSLKQSEEFKNYLNGVGSMFNALGGIVDTTAGALYGGIRLLKP